jgi:glycosyltransferase involved in cell wall biosynthesis
MIGGARSHPGGLAKPEALRVGSAVLLVLDRNAFDECCALDRVLVDKLAMLLGPGRALAVFLVARGEGGFPLVLDNSFALAPHLMDRVIAAMVTTADAGPDPSLNASLARARRRGDGRVAVMAYGPVAASPDAPALGELLVPMRSLLAGLRWLRRLAVRAAESRRVRDAGWQVSRCIGPSLARRIHLRAVQALHGGTEEATARVAPQAPDTSPEQRVHLLLATWQVAHGGAERWLCDLIRCLPPDETRLTLVTTDPGRHIWGERILPHVAEFWPLGDLLPLHSRAAGLVQLVEHCRPRLIYTNFCWVTLDALATLRRRAPATRVVCQLHMLADVEDPRHARPDFRAYDAFIDRYVVVSHRLKRQLCASFGVEPDRIAVIHLGADTARFRAPPRRRRGELVMLYVARMDHQKDPLLMCRVARALHERGVRDVRFEVIGDGPLLGRVRRYLARHRLEQMVRIHGAVDATPFYRHAHAALLTSRGEGIPLVAFECLAASIPLIAPVENSALDEIANTGIAVLARESVDEYVAAILRLRDHEEYRLMLAERAHAEHAKYDCAEAASRYRALFSEVLGSRPASGGALAN